MRYKEGRREAKGEEMMEGTSVQLGRGSALWGVSLTRLHPPPPQYGSNRSPHSKFNNPHLCICHSHSCVSRVSERASLPFSAALCEPASVSFSSSCQISSTNISKRFPMGMITYRTPGRWVCFGGGKRPRRPRVWKTRQKRGTINKSQKLLERVRTLSNVKEEVYGALDAFIAWEVEFPLVAVKKALKILKLERNWKRIIQISKWMIGKGQGKTLGTYLLLLEAFDKEGRIEEAQELWQKVFTVNMECTPRTFFSRMISMYDHHGMVEELLEVFADMEELEVRPEIDAVEKIALTYQKLGDLDKAERVRKKYPPPKWRYRTVNGMPIKIRTSLNEHQSSSGGFRIHHSNKDLDKQNQDVGDERYLRDNSRDEDLSGISGEEDFSDTAGEEEEEFEDSEGEEEEEFGTDNHHWGPRQATVDEAQFVR